MSAPAELEPLPIGDAQMRAFAAAGHFPLIEAAKRAGRAGLALAASAQTFAGLAAFAGVGAYFAWRGFVSERIRGWSDALWIWGVCLLCFTPALYPSVTPQMVDYAVTASQRRDAGQRARPAITPIDAVYGAEGLNRRMSPAIFLAERGLFAALFLAFLSACCHDLGYRLRETLEESGFVDEETSPARRKSGAGGRGGARAGKEEGRAEEPSGQSFGHRGAYRPGAGPTGERAKAYAALGVQAGASRREIERAYRALMKRAHPDHGGSAERAAALNAARDVLLRRG